MSSLSWSAVHPVSPPEMANGAVIPRVRMKEVQGMPGTVGGLVLRLCQFFFAVIGLAIMATTPDFPSVAAFRYLVAAVSLQSVWSLSLAIADVYALSVGRTLRNVGVARSFTIGDAITSTLTYAAACASAGITVLLKQDMGICNENHCSRFMSATAMAFLSWFAASSSFFFNFWSLASR